MELLINLQDTVPSTADNYAASLRRGHVIVCCPDGWPWSEHERSKPEWAIVSVALTQIEADALTAAPQDMSAQRFYCFNVDGLPATLSRDELMARVL